MGISQPSSGDLELRKMHVLGTGNNCFGVDCFFHGPLHVPLWNKSFVTSWVKDSDLGVIAVASCAAV